MFRPYLTILRASLHFTELIIEIFPCYFIFVVQIRIHLFENVTLYFFLCYLFWGSVFLCLFTPMNIGTVHTLD
jgi:hypothetical protein